MVKPKNQHIKQMDLVSDSQLLELLQVEGHFYWSEKKLFVPRWWKKKKKAHFAILVVKIPIYLSNLGSSIKDLIQGSQKVAIEVGRF